MSTTASPVHDTRRTILEAGQRIMAGKGFSAVGLNEVLVAASVPKGSFYHYFASKEAFGEALLEAYFQDYLREMDILLGRPGRMADRLLDYFRQWQLNQSVLDCQGKCLAVKLGAEVSDLSDVMRSTLVRGTGGIIDRLESAIEAGTNDGSLSVAAGARDTAESLYQLWVGASVMVKITRSSRPFEGAMATTRALLRSAG